MYRSMLLMGLIASTILPLDGLPLIAQTAPTPSRILLQEKSLSKDISLYVMEQLANTFYKTDIISVEIVGGYFPDPNFRTHGTASPQANPASFENPRLKDMKIQVWVLKADGTTLAQKASPEDGWICNGGECNGDMMFIFEHVAPDEVAGVVVRVGGKLLVRDIQADR